MNVVTKKQGTSSIAPSTLNGLEDDRSDAEEDVDWKCLSPGVINADEIMNEKFNIA